MTIEKKYLKSQSALEFVFLASFMLLVILGFFSVASSKVLEAREEGNRKIAEDIANFASREIEIAKSVNDGYARIFVMPENVNNVEYCISIVDNRELVVNYVGYEHIKFLPSNVSGNISWGLNEIKKINGIVYLGTIQTIECNDRFDNDLDGKVDLADAGCINSSDNDETNCGDAVCEGGENCAFCSSDCGVCLNILLLMRDITSNVISFLDNGTVVLNGTLQQQVIPIATSDDEFIFKSSTGGNAAIINLITGNMLISGSLFQNQATLTPSTSNNFIVKDSSGNVVSYINELGNFYLKGPLIQNSIPQGEPTNTTETRKRKSLEC